MLLALISYAALKLSKDNKEEDFLKETQGYIPHMFSICVN